MMMMLYIGMHHDQDCRLVQGGRHWQGSEVKLAELDARRTLGRNGTAAEATALELRVQEHRQG
jgi:hypothetical protein